MVESFCGFRLQSAAVIIGYVGAVGYLVLSIFDIVCLANINYIIDVFFNETNQFQPFVPYPSDQFADAESKKLALIIFLAVFLILNVANCLSSILLVVGTLKERHLYLLPWLLNYSIYIVYSVSINLNNFFGLINAKADTKDIIAAFIYMIFSTGLSFYVLRAIKSLYMLFRDASDRQRLLSTNRSTQPSYTII